MTDFGLILIGAALADNFVLARMLGAEPWLDAPPRLAPVAARALVAALTLTLAAAAGWLVEHALLHPLQAEFLRPFALILLAVGLSLAVAHALRRWTPALAAVADLRPALLGVDSTVLAAALLAATRPDGFVGATALGLGAGLGFGLVLLMFAAMRARLAAAPVPLPFCGAPIGLVTAALMALAFLGFAGMGR